MKTIAAFDFDGTISYRDSLTPFLFFTHGFFRALLNLFICLPVLVGFLFGIGSRQTVKERILCQFYKGIPLTEMLQMGERYVQKGIEVRPEIMEKIKLHQEQGHSCILISASIDVYLVYWAKIMGFDAALTSRVEVDEKGNITGKLIGLNCRGPEKVTRLKQLLGEKKDYILYAYGDSKGDDELIQYADYGFYV